MSGQLKQTTAEEAGVSNIVVVENFDANLKMQEINDEYKDHPNGVIEKKKNVYSTVASRAISPMILRGRQNRNQFIKHSPDAGISRLDVIEPMERKQFYKTKGSEGTSDCMLNVKNQKELMHTFYFRQFIQKRDSIKNQSTCVDDNSRNQLIAYRSNKLHSENSVYQNEHKSQENRGVVAKPRNSANVFSCMNSSIGSSQTNELKM